MLLLLVLACASTGCSDSSDVSLTDEQSVVVVFTALDRIYSEPILKEFEQTTGIVVKPIYDTEAAKTTGLINRLIARRDNPECDVLWNNEIVQTESLAQMGLLASYQSPNAQRIPAHYRDPQYRWTGFAARMRVIIFNRDLILADAVPRRLADFADPTRRGRAAMALPFFGTTLTHMAVLHQVWGPERLEQWLTQMRANDVGIVAGNGMVRDLVAAGEYSFGLTDTDDAYNAMLDGKPVDVIIPDGENGAILIPNTVGLIANCPHPQQGRALIDFLLSTQVERRLAESRSAQIPLGQDLQELQTPWDELRRSTPDMSYNISQAAAGRAELVQLLQRVGMDR